MDCKAHKKERSKRARRSSSKQGKSKRSRTMCTQSGDQRLPVTLLSGFLGSGKTTLLRRILTAKHGMKIAVLVNDMAALNIDGHTVGKLIQREAKLVQMQNGCICCTLREDLLQEVSKLAAEKCFDYLVIESTGISEPMQVAETFTFPLPTLDANRADADNSPDQQGATNGKRKGQGQRDQKHDHGSDQVCLRTLNSVARLDTCVTVMDASTFWDNLQSIEELKDRHPEETPEGDDRNVASLLTDQIEFADVILLNKTDLVSKKQVKRIQSVISTLNPSARLFCTTQANVDLDQVVNTGLFSLEKASQSAGWLQALNTPGVTPKSESEEYGITSFVYHARQPFHPGRLYRDFLSKYFLTRVVSMVAEEPGSDGEEASEDTEESENESENESEDGTEGESEGEDEGERDTAADYSAAAKKAHAARCKDLGNLLRSKGFCWVATANNMCMDWSHAGSILMLAGSGQWFACAPEDVWPVDEVVRAKVKADFDSDPTIGDRRQELVFIGQDLKESAIRALLDACLATPQEQALAAKGELEDPLLGDDSDSSEDSEA